MRREGPGREAPGAEDPKEGGGAGEDSIGEEGGIAAVVPSAGRSRRFGPDVEKPLLPVPPSGARPRSPEVPRPTFVERVVQTLLQAGCHPVVVAVRDPAGEVARRARTAGALVVPTADEEAGPIGSIRAALQALPPQTSGLLLHPVDHPLVRVETVRALIQAFRSAAPPGPSVVTPVHDGRHGHPVLLHRDLFHDLRQPGLAEGARTVVRRHRKRGLEVPVDDPGVVADVDDPGDYRRWVDEAGPPARTGETSDAPGAGDVFRPGGGDALDAARAAEFVLAETARGRGVAVWLGIRGQGIGLRLAVTEVDARGTLGGPDLDREAVRLGRERLARPGSPATDTVTLREDPTLEAYLELHRPVPELVVVGAGHIASPLSEVGALLGFRVTVLDDRPEFADRSRFPAASRVERIDMADPFAAVDVGPGTHVVLVTRGHRYDAECLRHLLALPRAPGYVGMIGSRRRVRATWEAMLRQGFPRERLSMVHAPVGLDVGAETPAEIAVAVAAEIVRARRGGTGRPLREVERVLERFFPEPDADMDDMDDPGGSPDVATKHPPAPPQAKHPPQTEHPPQAERPPEAEHPPQGEHPPQAEHPPQEAP